MTRQDFANKTRKLQRDFMKKAVAEFGVPEITKVDNGPGNITIDSTLEEYIKNPGAFRIKRLLNI